MADGVLLPASVAAGVGRWAAPVQGDQEPAASVLLSEHSVESVSVVALCKPAVDQFAEQSSAVGEPPALPVSLVPLPQVARAVRAAQPAELLPEWPPPLELQEPEAVLPGELQALAQPESWPRVLMPELRALPAARQAAQVDERSVRVAA